MPIRDALETDTGTTAGTRALNDAFRRTFTGGRVLMTSGVAALPDAQRAVILARVRSFADFDESNDPYGEHDFGALTVEGERIFFKIDYLDRGLTGHLPDPADPSVTARVLTVMLAEEY